MDWDQIEDLTTENQRLQDELEVTLHNTTHIRFTSMDALQVVKRDYQRLLEQTRDETERHHLQHQSQEYDETVSASVADLLSGMLHESLPPPEKPLVLSSVGWRVLVAVSCA